MDAAHLDGVPIADVHTGLRVKAVWAPESERKRSTGASAGSMGLGEAVTGWEPTGEPDTPSRAVRGAHRLMEPS